MDENKIRKAEVRAGFRWSACLGAWLAAAAGAQTAAILDADLYREYAQAGRVGGSLGRAKPENQLQVKDAVAAYVTEDSLFVQPLRVACTLPICGAVCFAQAEKTFAYALPTEDTIPPLGLLRAERAADGELSVVLALALPGERIQRIEVRVAGDGTARREAGSPLTLAGSPGIRAFADLPPPAGGAPAAFLALGLKGSLRRIAEMSGSLSESPLLSGTSDDFLCQGEGWIGTAQGRIWWIRSGFAAPYLEAAVQPASSGRAIGRIDAYVAQLAPDSYLLNRGTAWTGPQPAVAGLVGVSPRWLSGRTALQLWLEQGGRAVEFGQAPETVRYRRDGGPWISDSVRSIPYAGSETRVYEISLRDPDRNLPAFRIAFFSYDYMLPGPLVGVATEPEVGCAATGWCLPGDEVVMTLTLRPDSMSLSFPVLEGRREVPPPCNTPVFVGERKRMTVSRPWRQGDWFIIGKAAGNPLEGRHLDFSYMGPNGIGRGRDGGMPAAPALRGFGNRPAWEAGPGARVDAVGRRLIERTPRAGAGARRPARR